LDILNQIVNPLLAQYPGQIDLRLLELSNPSYYQALLKVEAAYAVKAEERTKGGLLPILRKGQG